MRLFFPASVFIRPFLAPFVPPVVALAVALALLVGLSGCARPRPAEPETAGRPLTVAAAASLQYAFTEIGRQFEAETGQNVVFTFGSSGNLAQQILSGAPVDLFASADSTFTDILAQKGLLVPETRRAYAVGRLVLASSRTAGVQLDSLEALLDPRVHKVAIANPGHAPYGRAAREALVNAGLWEQLQPKLVYGENIRQTLQFVETGNAEAGLVALSVAEIPGITYVPLPEELYQPLQQEMAVVQGTPNPEAARQFLSFVTGPAGQAVLREHGLTPPAAP